MDLKIKAIMSIVIGSSLFFNVSQADTQHRLKGCAAKKQNIERQLSYAKAHNNEYRVRGLEKALSETEYHCSDASLERSRAEKVSDKQRKVSKREAELREAKETGNAEKIAKKMKKVDEAKTELAEAQAATLR
ncbi:DUF1090 domain-containing protein [Enterobacteriaceae bacterium 89]|nr:DUF1090 domain-containing protein [Enterobacteriaceae bacterium 89]